MSQTIYVTGHKHPDTDSVASAIAYAYLKNQQGVDCVACRLGELNDETKYLLDRFGFVAPYYLKDARVSLSDIALDDPLCVHPDTTIYETLQLMENENKPSIAVTDDTGKVLGIIANQDISKIGMGDTSLGIDLLKVTSVENIAKTLDGTIVYNDEQFHLNGKVSIIALAKQGLTNYDVQSRIVMLGDDKDAQIQAIQKGAGILIVVWAKSVDPDVIEQAKQYHCPIIISGHGAMNTSRYLYFAPVTSLLMHPNPVSFHYWELAEDASKKMAKSRFRSYPVLDENDALVGYVSRYHILNSKNKSIVMVDHNEFSQSVRAIEKAELIEVIDHHRISDFSTRMPVAFRNEIVGSTATILTGIFQERQVAIPKNLAGLLLGAILSDTLKFRSPTTTQKDIFMANVLAQIAQVNIDDFAKDMFSVSTNIADKSMIDIMHIDLKTFDLEEQKVAISQVIIYNFEDIKGREKEIKEALDELLLHLEAKTFCVAFTSITDGGSIIYAQGECKDWIEEAFPNERTIQAGILSRKNQIVPILMDVFSHH